MFVWLRNHSWLTFVALAAMAGLGVYYKLPPRTITIETGSLGGTYHQVAEEYKTALEKLGFFVKLRTRDQSIMLIDDVNNPASGIDVGFIAQSTNPALYPNVTTLGSIGYQPLFIFYRAELASVTGLSDLQGRRVAVLPEASATNVAALGLLNEYGITAQNATLETSPLPEAVRRIKVGEVDAAFFMLEAGNPIIRSLASDPALRMVSLPQAAAVAQRFPFLHAATIPAGTYSLLRNQPGQPIDVVAATSDVVVRKDMHPAVVYALLTAMTAIHNKSGIISKQGEFPALKDPQVPANPYAQDYYKNGLPWVHRNFNVVFAAMCDTFLVLLLPIFLIMPVYQWLGFPTAAEAYSRFRRRVWLQTLRTIDKRLEVGAPLTLRQRALLDVIEEDLDADGDVLTECKDILGRARLQVRHARRVGDVREPAALAAS